MAKLSIKSTLVINDQLKSIEKGKILIKATNLKKKTYFGIGILRRIFMLFHYIFKYNLEYKMNIATYF